MGEGIGAGAEIPVVPKILDFEARALWGYGTGRYGSTQLPDVTYDASGELKPIENAQILVGLIGHVTPLLDVYAFAGTEQDWNTTTGTAGFGYGIHGDTAGCNFESGSTAATSSEALAGDCAPDFHRVSQVTVGDWWKLYSGAAGTVQWGVQVSSTRFDAFRGVDSHFSNPHTFENQIYSDFRYLPFQ
jgi:hypothetical protein